jgi:glycosyltransferase involved in cell wall biosynthesis
MISIIMPTLWKGEYYKRMLPVLNNHPLIGEIIIIDNNVNETDQTILQLDKVRHIKQKENIYVNPAWNLGVQLAQYERICLYSDDVLFDTKCLESAYQKCSPDNGIIAFSLETISENCDDLQVLTNSFASWESMEIKATNFMHYRFGICMFMHKASYYLIPEEYKVYYGDTYLFDTNVIKGKQHYAISACAVATKMKTTSKHFSDIIESDKEAFYRNNPTDNLISELIKNW